MIYSSNGVIPESYALYLIFPSTAAFFYLHIYFGQVGPVNTLADPSSMGIAVKAGHRAGR
jgi:hypothetical protein